MTTYPEVLLNFYRGEVGGEAFYSAMVAAARNDTERLKWATLLQLETETKAWLRAPLLQHGVSIEERAEDRAAALYDIDFDIDEFKTWSWMVQIRDVHDVLADRFVPAYQRYWAEARERGNAHEQAVCRFMVEHEQAQLEFARRELAGAPADESLEPVVRLLRYPLSPG